MVLWDVQYVNFRLTQTSGFNTLHPSFFSFRAERKVHNETSTKTSILEKEIKFSSAYYFCKAANLCRVLAIWLRHILSTTWFLDNVVRRSLVQSYRGSFSPEGPLNIWQAYPIVFIIINYLTFV